MDKVLAHLRANLLSYIDHAAHMRKSIDPLIQGMLKCQNQYNSMVSEKDNLQMIDAVLNDALDKKVTAARKEQAELKAKDSKKARLST